MPDSARNFVKQAAVIVADLLREYAPDVYASLEEHIQQNAPQQRRQQATTAAPGKRKQAADRARKSSARKAPPQKPQSASAEKPKAPVTKTNSASTRAAKKKTPGAKTKRGGGDKSQESNDLLSPKEFAQRINVKADQTIRNRIRQSDLIGWKVGGRGYVLPVGQLSRKNQPIAGLNEIVSAIGNHKEAWQWLNTPSAQLDNNTPLSMLRRGSTKRVREAAAAYAESGKTGGKSGS